MLGAWIYIFSYFSINAFTNCPLSLFFQNWLIIGHFWSTCYQPMVYGRDCNKKQTLKVSSACACTHTCVMVLLDYVLKVKTHAILILEVNTMERVIYNLHDSQLLIGWNGLWSHTITKSVCEIWSVRYRPAYLIPKGRVRACHITLLSNYYLFSGPS